MSSILDITNGVLCEIAQVPVTSVTDTEKSLIISNNIDRYHQDLLRRAAWNFALAFFTSDTPLTTNISPEFLYNYKLPANYGRFHRWQFSSSVQFGLVYVIQNGVMMTDSRPINFYYVVNDCDLSVISTAYEQALIYYLTAQLCHVLTNNGALAKEKKMDFWDNYLPSAIQQNNMEIEIVQTPYNDYDRQSYI